MTTGLTTGLSNSEMGIRNSEGRRKWGIGARGARAVKLLAVGAAGLIVAGMKLYVMGRVVFAPLQRWPLGGAAILLAWNFLMPAVMGFAISSGWERGELSRLWVVGSTVPMLGGTVLIMGAGLIPWRRRARHRRSQPFLRSQLMPWVFVTVLLDTKNRLLREEMVSEGTLNESLVHPREVFRAAIREGANSVAFVHNHPSGDPQPSQDDKVLTQQLIDASRLIGIKVLDHVIIGDGRFFSFQEEGLL